VASRPVAVCSVAGAGRVTVALTPRPEREGDRTW
jgi:hypothetical protein